MFVEKLNQIKNEHKKNQNIEQNDDKSKTDSLDN